MQLSNCRKSKFLIGCYRSKDKKQLDWILGKSNRQFALYNVRSGKKRDGWVNVQNPKVKAPDIVLMYDLENPTDYIAYKVSACKEYSEQEMADSGYPNPKGSYLVYTLSTKLQVENVAIQTFLANYATSHENYIKGKPIYCTGSELIATIVGKQIKNQKSKIQQDTFLTSMEMPTVEQIIEDVRPKIHYAENALTSIDLFSGCGGLTKGFSMAGVRSIFASDIDENAAKTFCRNFPDTPFLCKSITDVEKNEVDELLEGKVPDIIIMSKVCSLCKMEKLLKPSWKNLRMRVNMDIMSHIKYLLPRIMEFLKIVSELSSLVIAKT